MLMCINQNMRMLQPATKNDSVDVTDFDLSMLDQETLLGICSNCGLDSSKVLASDAPLPEDLSLAFAVATDDLMVFSDREPGTTLEAITRFEAALSDASVLKNPEKDVDDTTATTCVGVDLVAGTRWCPPGARV